MTIDNTVQARELISELEYAILGVQVAGNLDRVTKAKAALAAALTAPAAVEGWQDIATAPKDGSAVLLALEDDGDEGGVGGFVGQGRWIEADEDGPDNMGHDAGFVDDQFDFLRCGRSFGNPKYQSGGVQPTHWQPLPPAPGAAPSATAPADAQIEDAAIAVFTASQGPAPMADKLGRIDAILRALLAQAAPVVEPGAQAGREAAPPEFDLSTSAGGRGYIAWYFTNVMKRHDFNRYIHDTLAADFACVLARWLRDGMATARATQGDRT